jgi:hypothetical protein
MKAVGMGSTTPAPSSSTPTPAAAAPAKAVAKKPSNKKETPAPAAEKVVEKVKVVEKKVEPKKKVEPSKKASAAKEATAPAPSASLSGSVPSPPPSPTTTPSVDSDVAPILTSARKARLANLKATTEELAIMNSAMKKELDSTVLKDLDKLSEEELRYRVVQLAAEMGERVKWEAVRMQEFLRQNERRLEGEWEGRVGEVRRKMEEVMSRELREQEDRIERKNNQKRAEELEHTKAVFENAWKERQETWVKAMQEEMEVKLGEETTRARKGLNNSR